MSAARAAASGLAILAALAITSCGGASPAEDAETAEGGATRNAGGEASPAFVSSEPPADAPGAGAGGLGASCEGYLRAYERCEPLLRGEILAGDRRDAEHERAWLEYLVGTPEGAELDQTCEALRRELPASCP